MSGYSFSFQLAQYLLLRGDARVYDWTTLNANAKYFSDARRAAMANWDNKPIDIRTDEVTFIMKRRKEVMRMAALKVLEQNELDVFVNPPLLDAARQDRPAAQSAGGAPAAATATARGSAFPRCSCRPVSPTRSTSRRSR